MSVTVQANCVITITDNSSGAVTLQKQVVGSYVGTVSEFASNVLFGTSPTSVSLPGSPTNFVYIRNLSTTANLTVSWTPNGGSSNEVILLEPTSFLILDENNASAGITALSVTASAATTPAEYILCA